ncbi:hypothetical protein SUGI_1488310 [Cryptomeria japonica]|uniref:Uncharacterized protein n=1 Tax=Cryptomeria japonica TaxID=3369 RepID=A0AAD3NS62_CRYJA|nr:hypothetical protein SUGI_1373080 [Cryptomeria japonica]GLJ59008.1 hypothetical protein SUGI_1488310 [Cryptomeria japonica]
MAACYGNRGAGQAISRWVANPKRSWHSCPNNICNRDDSGYWLGAQALKQLRMEEDQPSIEHLDRFSVLEPLNQLESARRNLQKSNPPNQQSTDIRTSTLPIRVECCTGIRFWPIDR